MMSSLGYDYPTGTISITNVTRDDQIAFKVCHTCLPSLTFITFDNVENYRTASAGFETTLYIRIETGPIQNTRITEMALSPQKWLRSRVRRTDPINIKMESMSVSKRLS